ncbi:MAG: hypothetical protein M1814_000479 [Vezdaea aestivalis]|nr:MAG: hypothetical protein M1814_000479 [Vezdaea aestivalis]
MDDPSVDSRQLSIDYVYEVVLRSHLSTEPFPNRMAAWEDSKEKISSLYAKEHENLTYSSADVHEACQTIVRFLREEMDHELSIETTAEILGNLHRLPDQDRQTVHSDISSRWYRYCARQANAFPFHRYASEAQWGQYLRISEELQVVAQRPAEYFHLRQHGGPSRAARIYRNFGPVNGDLHAAGVNDAPSL